MTTRLIVALLLFFPVVLRSDYVTTRSNHSFFCHVVSLNGSTLRVRTQFPDGEKSFELEAASVSRIEFNSTENNPGAVPEFLALREPKRRSAEMREKQGDDPPIDAKASDVVFEYGGTGSECQISEITERVVSCFDASRKLISRPRHMIRSIRFASR